MNLEVVRDPEIDVLLRQLRAVEADMDTPEHKARWAELDRVRLRTIREIKERTCCFPKMRYSRSKQ
jgi:hypothetical protein